MAWNTDIDLQTAEPIDFNLAKRRPWGLRLAAWLTALLVTIKEMAVAVHTTQTIAAQAETDAGTKVDTNLVGFATNSDVYSKLFGTELNNTHGQKYLKLSADTRSIIPSLLPGDDGRSPSTISSTLSETGEADFGRASTNSQLRNDILDVFTLIDSDPSANNILTGADVIEGSREGDEDIKFKFRTFS